MLIHWIWFAELEGLSHRQKLNILRQGIDPEELYHAASEDLSDIPQAEVFAQKDLNAAREIADACRKNGIGILTFRDAGFPSRLRNVEDGPVLLYYKGTIPDLDAQPVVALVGTRKATPYGLRVAKTMAGQIADCGGLVISGGAYGVDTAAMEGALYAGHTTIAVLGCGIDIVYPAANRKLFEDVSANGCLISEYPPGTKPEHWHFPERNRIISGICHGVLVVEAPRKSGALITARCALEQGRDVYTVPGNIDSAACEGSNALLMDGAQPAMSGWDIMQNYEALFPDRVHKQQTPVTSQQNILKENDDKKVIDYPAQPLYSGLVEQHPELSEEEKNLLSYLSSEPVLMDDVIARTQIPAAKVLSMMTMLSVKGVVVMHPGRRVSVK